MLEHTKKGKTNVVKNRKKIQENFQENVGVL